MCETLSQWQLRVREAEQRDYPILEQKTPVWIGVLFEQFLRDPETAGGRYREKAVVLEGIVLRVGPDVTGEYVIQLSDCSGGSCCALLWGCDAGQISGIRVGARIICRGIVLYFRRALGVVVKHCEILETEEETVC